MTRFFRHEIVDSTNDRAFDALASGQAQDGDVHVARGQTTGRGRLGRRWESAADEGLYLSMVHLPGAPGPAAPAVTMAAGLATLEACIELGLEGSQLEWPNDVMCGSAKLAGILVETRGFDPEKPQFVIGIGVNVGQKSFSEELSTERAVTSLSLMGVEATLGQLEVQLAARLGQRLHDATDATEDLAREYLDATGLEGARVEVVTGRETVEGRLLELDLDTGLLLHSVRGPVRVNLAHVHAVARCSL